MNFPILIRIEASTWSRWNPLQAPRWDERHAPVHIAFLVCAKNCCATVYNHPYQQHAGEDGRRDRGVIQCS